MADPAPAARRGRWVPIVLLAIAAAGLLTAIVGLSTEKGGDPVIEVSGINDAQQIFGGVESSGDRLGSSDAPVSIQIYNDVQCSDCGDQFLSTIPPLVENEVRDGEVQLLYRNYSFSVNPVQQGFIAAEAAGIQGYEWPYVYLLFRNQAEAERLGGISGDLLDSIAGSIEELMVPDWEKDFADGGGPDGSITAALREQDKTARDLKLRAAPSAIINGPHGTVTLQDSPDLDQFHKAIQQVS